MDFLEQHILPHLNYWVYVILLMTGLHAMITKNNLIKKLIGMSIFQTAIILFFVSLGVKSNADIPILPHHHHHHDEEHHEPHAGAPDHGAAAVHGAKKPEPAAPSGAHHDGADSKHGAEAAHAGEGHGAAAEIDPAGYANPLPHVLMLTAIVVGVATLGVALAISQRIFKEYGSLEEDQILAQIASSDG